MKRLLIALLTSLTLTATAQDNTWEQMPQSTTANNDAKYLAGAVPEAEGQLADRKSVV